MPDDAPSDAIGGGERQFTLTGSIAQEQVVVERIDAIEALSEPFEFKVDLISTLGPVALTKHMGQKIGVKIAADPAPRWFQGYITELAALRETHAGMRYRLTCRPWTYFLDRNENFRIHEDKTAIEIIKLRLGGYGLQCDVGGSVKAVKRRYCVQYGESDFAFISRLLEEEGLYYYFKHDESGHKLSICGSKHAHDFGAPAALDYVPDAMALTAGRLDISGNAYMATRVVERLSARSVTKVKMQDWNFRQSANVVAEKAIPQKEGLSGVHSLLRSSVMIDEDEGQGVSNQDKAKASVEATIEQMLAQEHAIKALAQAQGLQVAHKLDITGYVSPHGGNPETYLIARTRHVAVAEQYRSGTTFEPEPENEADDLYFVELEMIPATVQFRPQNKTPRPVVNGLESALVVSGTTDPFGRVKVKFPWAAGSSDEQSCWLRVSQSGGLGNIIMPRPGHEVLVDFLGGNPDRPVVVGRVFDKANMPIYPLPANQTMATWRTKTWGASEAISSAINVGGGGFDWDRPDANEVRFEDKPGKEELYIHANRLMNVRVQLNETHKVGQDKTDTIGNDKTETIGNNKTVTVGNDRTVTVEKGNDTLRVMAGNISIKADAGKIEIEAMQSIQLKVGSNTIKIDQTGITVKGIMINSEAQATHTMKGAVTTTEASGIMTVKGSLTKIN